MPLKSKVSGAALEALRPEEPADERIRWLRSFGIKFDGGRGDMLMDACDYRGQYLSAPAEDCAQVTGRCYWMPYS